MGGDEASVTAEAFSGVYARARALGLKTSVHAGEWAGPDAITAALDALRPDRLDHGIAAAADPRLCERLALEETTLFVAPSGNAATGAVPSLADHPLRRLLDSGVRVALSADDPLLFATTTANEYRVAKERLGLSDSELRRLAGNAWRAAFCSRERRDAGLAALEAGNVER
jgi:adenosine deaminase